MSLNVIFLIFAIFLIVACLTFIEQRAELEIGREIGYDIRTLILPMWCVASAYSWVIVAGLIIYTFMYYSWKPAAVMALLYFIVPGFIPIPQSTYEGVYKKMAVLLKTRHAECLEFLPRLMASPVYDKIAKYM